MQITWVTDLLDYSLWADGPNKVGFCRPDLPDGAAQWDTTKVDRGLAYVCPCGCKEWRRVPVEGQRKWNWDGDELAPTLTPSILHISRSEERCHWHGFLTAGKWITV
jgi:hypothetical protein